jgi:hypothetical protein
LSNIDVPPPVSEAQRSAATADIISKPTQRRPHFIRTDRSKVIVSPVV